MGASIKRAATVGECLCGCAWIRPQTGTDINNSRVSRNGVIAMKSFCGGKNNTFVIYIFRFPIMAYHALQTKIFDPVVICSATKHILPGSDKLLK